MLGYQYVPPSQSDRGVTNIGTAYAVWTEVGAVGTVLMGIILFNEPTDFWRLFFITTLIASIIGLKVVSN